MLLDFDIEKHVPGFTLNANLTVEADIIVLFGPSGAGKSLTVQCLAGVARPDRGHIVLNGEPLFDGNKGLSVPPQRRRIGYVPQNYALFPHLTIAENIAFGLRHWTKEQSRAEVARLVSLLGLDGLEDRRPWELSGGQQQRVALARAVATRPRLLLLDEPLSALDPSLRASLRADLLRIQEEMDVGIVFVTHDLADAYTMADSIAVYDAGRVLQVGPIDEVFQKPQTATVARLTGAGNLLKGQVVVRGPKGICVDVGEVRLWGDATEDIPTGDPALVVIRPENVRLLHYDEVPEEDEEVVPVIVQNITHLGRQYVVQISLGDVKGPMIEIVVPVWWWNRYGSHPDSVYRIGIARSAVRVLPACSTLHHMKANTSKRSNLV